MSYGWPGDIESVTVEWMDGKNETFKCNRLNGEETLHLWTVYTGSDRRYDEHDIPKCNVRVITVNKVQT
jgi:hypothetical protein